jgi:glycerol-3-phosphate dehydrogenase
MGKQVGVIVFGGGLNWLSACNDAIQNGFDVVLYEDYAELYRRS